VILRILVHFRICCHVLATLARSAIVWIYFLTQDMILVQIFMHILGIILFYDIDRIFHARSRYEFATHRSAVVLLFGVLEYKKRDVANWSEK